MTDMEFANAVVNGTQDELVRAWDDFMQDIGGIFKNTIDGIAADFEANKRAAEEGRKAGREIQKEFERMLVEFEVASHD